LCGRAALDWLDGLRAHRLGPLLAVLSLRPASGHVAAFLLPGLPVTSLGDLLPWRLSRDLARARVCFQAGRLAVALRRIEQVEEQAPVTEQRAPQGLGRGLAGPRGRLPRVPVTVEIPPVVNGKVRQELVMVGDLVAAVRRDGG